MTDIAANLAIVRSRIEAAAERTGRDPGDITLVAVSKTQPVDALLAAYGAGQQDFGENRVQEAAEKIPALRSRGRTPRWHLVGHLQTNKVKVALELFDILHSVDSTRLAETVARYARRPVAVFVEVNMARESTKFGATPESVPELVRSLRRLPELDVRGLMTVAPRVDDPEEVRPVFRQLRQLCDAMELRELSMGMTDDFETAVEEGSTHVRVGRAIFGPRVG